MPSAREIFGNVVQHPGLLAFWTGRARRAPVNALLRGRLERPTPQHELAMCFPPPW